MKPARSFASDNNAGIHPQVLKAIAEANYGHSIGYGDDEYTQSAVRKFKQHFGSDTEVFIVFNGTAANCLSLKALTDSYHAVICSETAHIYTDECGAPERFTGCKLIPIPTRDGKLTVELVGHAYHGIGDQHHVGSIVQSCFKLGEFAGIDAQRFRLVCARLATDRDRAQAERRPVAGVTAANRTEADDQRAQRGLHLVNGP